MRRFTAIAGLVSLAALPAAGEERVELAVAPEIEIPAGEFWRGSDTVAVHHALALCRAMHPVGHALGACRTELFDAEVPFGRVYVRRFSIDRLEVTRAEYARCERAGACVPPRLGAGDPRIGAPRHPVVGVTAHDAEDYCRFVGGRLPSDDEWEKAARGATEPRAFPWGDYWDPRLVNHGGEGGRMEARDGARHLALVGSYPGGASPYGLLDVAGNAWEWTASHFSSREPSARASTRSIRGGSFRSTAVTLRVAHRASLSASEYAPDVGFRCAYDPR